MKHEYCWMICLSATLAAPAAADVIRIEPILLTGDAVDGFGPVQAVTGIVMNNQGRWCSVASREYWNGAYDSALIRNGRVRWLEGDRLVEPANAVIDGFGTFAFNDAGDVIGVFDLDGVQRQFDQGIYASARPLALKGDAAPEGLPPGSVFSAFYNVVANDAGTAAFIGRTIDPADNRNDHTGLFTVTSDDRGNPGPVRLHLLLGEPIPGRSLPTYSVGSPSINDANVLATVATEEPSYDNGLLRIHNDGTIESVFWSGDAFGDLGVWSSLDDYSVDINSDGEIAFVGLLDGIEVVATDQRLVARARETLPGLSSPVWHILRPVRINDPGQVLWMGRLSDRRDVLFLDQEPLVITGETTVDGQLITGLSDYGEQIVSMSDDGRFIGFSGTLADGRSGVFAIYRYPALTMSPPEPGISGQENHIDITGATPGGRVVVAYGRRTGATPVPGCPGLNVEIAGARAGATGRADHLGRASLSFNVPLGVGGRGLLLQAIDVEGCRIGERLPFIFE